MTLLQLSGTNLLILVLGVTILVGFGADWIASRFRVPDVLWLIVLGLVAGPILHLVSPSTLLLIAPVLGVVTLLLILFDAGIDLRISFVRSLAGSALLFALACFVASGTLLFVAGDLVLFPGQPVLALLFATSLACTSGAVVIPLANRLGLAQGMRSLLHLDSAFEDAFAVITVTTILALLAPSTGSLALSLTVSLALPLPVGLAIGIAGGLVWLLFLYEYQNRPFAALATLGFLLVIYAVAQALGGSGILAALAFGVLLGNEEFVHRWLRRVRPFEVADDLRKVEVELAFLLRTFFLFLIGVIVVPSDPGIVADATVVVLIVGLLVVRRETFRAVTDPTKIPRPWAGPVTAFYGRGLTSAVLLIVAAERIPAASILFFPGLLLIVGTNVAMTAWLLAAPPQPERLFEEAERRWEALVHELGLHARPGAPAPPTSVLRPLGGDPGRGSVASGAAPPAPPPASPPASVPAPPPPSRPPLPTKRTEPPP